MAGTFVGSLVGEAVASTVATTISKLILDEFVDDDSMAILEIMEGVFVEMNKEYILAQDELEYIVSEMDKESYIRIRLEEFVTDACELRNFIILPSTEEIGSELVYEG